MKTEKQGNLTTLCDNDGHVVSATSYDTCLLVCKSGIVVLNATKYSVTTSKHQGKVRGMPMSGDVVIVRDCPRGADSYTLLQCAGL